MQRYDSSPACLLLLVSGLMVVPLEAQWIDYLPPGLPRTADGQPDLDAPAPQLNGKPDLSGVWQAESAPFAELARLAPESLGGQLGDDIPSKYFLSIVADFERGSAPLLPAAGPNRDSTLSGAGLPPSAICLQPSVPMINFVPVPFKFVHSSQLLAILYEAGPYRQIFLDGRPHPQDPTPSWMGYSIGSWEGDTLVVDTRGITDRSYLDLEGLRHSEALRVIERFQRVNIGTIQVETTLEDPAVFTEPITLHYNLKLVPDSDLIEYACLENETDQVHMPE